jgi:hypothetical protein
MKGIHYQMIFESVSVTGSVNNVIFIVKYKQTR